jgi:hypothetical protein
LDHTKDSAEFQILSHGQRVAQTVWGLRADQ